MNTMENARLRMNLPYFQAPNDIFDLTVSLTIYQKIVYLYLCRCSNQGAQAFPSYKTIADKCGMSRRKAIDTVRELIEFNLLTKENRKTGTLKDSPKDINDTNLYILNDPSACHAPTQCTGCTTLVHVMHHPSAQDAPNKELNKKNQIKRTNSSSSYSSKKSEVVKEESIDLNKKDEEDEDINPINISKELKRYYKHCTDNDLTDKQLEVIKSMMKNYSYSIDIIKRAMDEMSFSSGKSFRFIEVILKDWHKNRLTNIEKIESYLSSRARVNLKTAKGTFNNFTQRPYDSSLEEKLLKSSYGYGNTEKSAAYKPFNFEDMEG
jgi:DnaD/phage-associated family protein